MQQARRIPSGLLHLSIHTPYFCFRMRRRLIFQRRSRFCFVVSFCCFINKPFLGKINCGQPPTAGSIEPKRIAMEYDFGKAEGRRQNYTAVFDSGSTGDLIDEKAIRPSDHNCEKPCARPSPNFSASIPPFDPVFETACRQLRRRTGCRRDRTPACGASGIRPRLRLAGPSAF